MSRGPGKIERAIELLFQDHPDRIFTVDDLAAAAYPGINRPEKRHRVAVLRAGRNVASRLWWACSRREAKGGEAVFYNVLNVRSYALGRLRSDFINNDLSLVEVQRLIDDPTAHRSIWKRVQPGGAWHQHVEAAKLRRAGDDVGADAIMAGVAATIATERGCH